MAESAKVIIEVQAGLIPGQAEPEFTCRWAISSAEWEDGQADLASAEPVLRAYGHAQEYARALWDPRRVNWVRLDWVWL